MEELRVVMGNKDYIDALSISADGLVIVGSADSMGPLSDFTQRAFRWTARRPSRRRVK